MTYTTKDYAHDMSWEELDEKYPEHGKMRRVEHLHSFIQDFLRSLSCDEEARLYRYDEDDQLQRIDEIEKDAIVLRFFGIDQAAYIKEHVSMTEDIENGAQYDHGR